MGIFDDIKAKGAAYRLTEEALYAEALREIESGQRLDGTWAKAMAESDMDAGKAGAKYIKMRVQSLRDEISVFIYAAKKVETANTKQSIADAANRRRLTANRQLTKSFYRASLAVILGVILLSLCGFGFMFLRSADGVLYSILMVVIGLGLICIAIGAIGMAWALLVRLFS